MRRSVVCLVLHTMVDGARSLTNLLMVLDTPEFPLWVSPSLYPPIHTQHHTYYSPS